MNEDDVVPMDIDVSLNASKTSNRSGIDSPSSISFDSTESLMSPAKNNFISEYVDTKPIMDTADTNKIKTRRCAVRLAKHTNPKKISISLTRWLCFSAVILSISLHFIYNFYSIKCNPELNRVMIKNEFLSKLYGQNEQVELILNSLEKPEEITLTLLIGGTGVGKTYAANIIFNSMKNSTNALHMVAPGHRNKELSMGILQKIPLCKYNLLIIDGLGEHDLDVNFFLYNVIERSRTAGSKLDIILIFSTVKVSESLEKTVNNISKDRLEDFLKYLFVPIQIVEFAPLKQEHLVKCIQHAMRESHREYSNETISDLSNTLDVVNDGCKNVQSIVRSLI